MITVKLRHLRISPRKVRLVTDLIKGMEASKAESQLKFASKRSTVPILKLLRSAIAAASKDQGIDRENLYVSGVKVDGGPSLKRWRPRAMGRAAGILKRTSHITLTLSEKNPPAGKTAQKEVAKDEEKPVSTDWPKPEAKKLSTEAIGRVETENKSLPKEKSFAPKRPYQSDSRSKKKFFSRQTLGGAKKIFRRKSI